MRIIAYIEEFNIVSVIVRLMLSTFAGAVIGLERRVHGKSAGVKTFSLVCLGASLVMVTNEFLMDSYPSGDVARLGAQVISGVGFLGVGTIITAFFMGPLIEFFNVHVARPFLDGKAK